jgi:hypothetical protein
MGGAVDGDLMPARRKVLGDGLEVVLRASPLGVGEVAPAEKRDTHLCRSSQRHKRAKLTDE